MWLNYLIFISTRSPMIYLNILNSSSMNYSYWNINIPLYTTYVLDHFHWGCFNTHFRKVSHHFQRFGLMNGTILRSTCDMLFNEIETLTKFELRVTLLGKNMLRQLAYPK
jgi:hypothetical protein